MTTQPAINLIPVLAAVIALGIFGLLWYRLVDAWMPDWLRRPPSPLRIGDRRPPQEDDIWTGFTCDRPLGLHGCVRDEGHEPPCACDEECDLGHFRIDELDDHDGQLEARRREGSPDA